MKRSDFIKKGLAGLAVGATAATGIAKASESETLKKIKENVGFNHLPNMETITENTVLHKASTRGAANHGWLQARHSFSFANWYNPERMGFGALRVLNDDIIAPSKGFGTHPHKDMEIITIPLEGDLEHKDSMGNKGVIRSGDVQVMSAGKGVYHSEFNHNDNSEVNLLQTWVIPNKSGVEPRYGQITMKLEDRENKWQQIVSPDANDDGAWVHQDTWYNIARLDAGKQLDYGIHKLGNGAYFFIIDGDVEVNGQTLNKRDGYGIWNFDKTHVVAKSKAEVLVIEVPMQG